MIVPQRAGRDAAALIRAGEAMPAAPLPRHLLSLQGWAQLAASLAEDPLPLVTLWSDGRSVHALFVAGQDPLVASVAVEAQRYLALSPARPAAAVCERMLRDLWGIEAMDARDLRPWLDHGAWGLTAPLAERPGPAAWPPESPEFELAPEHAAAGAFQLGIGPVQGLTSGPAHLRLTLDGERIRRAELLLGYAHRGILGAVRGRTPAEAAGLVARIDAETTVAHQAAFARAVEAAAGWRADAQTVSLRLAMGGLERIAVHLHHLARTARAAALDGSVAGRLRELLLQACGLAFGHRMMMGAIVPCEAARAPGEAGLAALLTALDRAEAALPEAGRALLGTAAARRLGGRGRLPAAVAASLVGGASMLPAGDAPARCRGRLDEIGAAIPLLRRLLLPDQAGSGTLGPAAAEPGPGLLSEAVGMADSAHGPVWHWLRLQGGRIEAMHVHDPALPLWLALEQAAVGLQQDELALLCASLGMSASGADL